ncbi:hypothetical protein [Micromonospora tarensis]|uniref:Uncharacterized protein n=1 Tax=Micromonospora tarensis TaxID=2806100 RepID=A0ABS1YI32_9ACTN|nr:hypothetical protein [Micromonospora tarensis]MBM0276973.1 hypothetical protein [Micromonospora tarensis]
MIEAIVSGVLVKIAEGSGAALVDLIRRRFVRRDEPGAALESLDRAARGDASADDLATLRALLRDCAAEDPEFLRELRHQSTSIGTTNVVASSNVGKLVQAQRVGDITM